MEEFFETGTIPEEHLVPALHEAIREDKLFPVLFTSGLGNVGVDELMDLLSITRRRPASITPSRAGRRRAEPTTRKGTDTSLLRCTCSNHVGCIRGRISYFKVFSGVLKNDASLQNYNRNTVEKFAHIS